MVFAIGALTFFAPFMLIIAGAIFLKDGTPVLYGHRRVGLGGRPFRCLKFRTMVKDGDATLARYLDQNPAARAEWDATRKLTDDPRIIKCVGHFLRKSSLDELPQFWNVLRGDMSIVGPRPVVKDEAVHYGEDFNHYLSVRPGITGAWQVSGRSDTTYAERVALDVDYVCNRSFAGDMGIIVKTIGVVLLRKGAR